MCHLDDLCHVSNHQIISILLAGQGETCINTVCLTVTGQSEGHASEMDICHVIIPSAFAFE